METNKDFEASGPASSGVGAGSRIPSATSADKSRRLENLGERADRLTDDIADKAQVLKDRAYEAMDSTKEKASETYDRTRDTLNRTYDRVIDYGRENPASAILMGFGVGVGVGLVLAGSAARRGRSRILPTIATSLADIVYDVFDRR